MRMIRKRTSVTIDSRTMNVWTCIGARAAHTSNSVPIAKTTVAASSSSSGRRLAIAHHPKLRVSARSKRKAR